MSFFKLVHSVFPSLVSNNLLSWLTACVFADACSVDRQTPAALTARRGRRNDPWRDRKLALLQESALAAQTNWYDVRRGTRWQSSLQQSRRSRLKHHAFAQPCHGHDSMIAQCSLTDRLRTWREPNLSWCRWSMSCSSPSRVACIRLWWPWISAVVVSMSFSFVICIGPSLPRRFFCHPFPTAVSLCCQK